MTLVLESPVAQLTETIRRVLVARDGLRWRDAPSAYGPHETPCNRWKRRGAAGVFTRMEGGARRSGYES